MTWHNDKKPLLIEKGILSHNILKVNLSDSAISGVFFFTENSKIPN
jgi:hypothetical protein